MTGTGCIYTVAIMTSWSQWTLITMKGTSLNGVNLMIIMKGWMNMEVNLNSIGSFILGFLCGILFLFIWAAIKIGDDYD